MAGSSAGNPAVGRQQRVPDWTIQLAWCGKRHLVRPQPRLLSHVWLKSLAPSVWEGPKHLSVPARLRPEFLRGSITRSALGSVLCLQLFVSLEQH